MLQSPGAWPRRDYVSKVGAHFISHELEPSQEVPNLSLHKAKNWDGKDHLNAPKPQTCMFLGISLRHWEVLRLLGVF